MSKDDILKLSVNEFRTPKGAEEIDYSNAPEVESGIPMPPDTKDPEFIRNLERKLVDNLLNGKPRTAKDTVKKAYSEAGVEIDDKAASRRVTALKQKESVISALELAQNRAQQDIVEIADYTKEHGKSFSKEGAAYANVALAANKEILDRTMGKAKQSIDVTTRAVTVNIDLTAN